MIFLLCVNNTKQKATIEYLKENILNLDPFGKRVISRKRLHHQHQEMSFRVEDLLEINTSSASTSESRVESSSSASESDVEDEESPYSAKSICNSIFFSTGNPHVEIITGLIHLFRTTTSSNSEKNTLSDLPSERSTTICVLAVPSFLSIADFCSFVSCFSSKIKHIRVLRDESPNRYMVVLDFCDQKSADSFYRQ